MAYIITIKKQTTHQVKDYPASKVYLKIHERNASEPWEGVKEYEWVENPNTEPTVKEIIKTEDVYTQTVEDLDLSAVIRAINKLDKIS